MKTKTVEVVAWFTPEIPVSTGPSWYQGLPGLILEVNDDKTTILCTKIVLNPDEKSKIKRPKKGRQYQILILLLYKTKKDKKLVKCGKEVEEEVLGDKYI